MIPSRAIFFCCLLSATSLHAAETGSVLRLPSPKGDLVLLVERHPQAADKLRLEGVSGKEFLTLSVNDDVKEESIVWNASGDGVAFAVGNSRLLDAHAFIRTKEGWKHLKLPEPGGDGKTWESHHCIPSKWEGSRLSLVITGPHEGKPDTTTYSGSMTVMIDPETGTAKKTGENIVVAKDEESR